jgi:hypothetical protein
LRNVLKEIKITEKNDFSQKIGLPIVKKRNNIFCILGTTFTKKEIARKLRKALFKPRKPAYRPTSMYGVKSKIIFVANRNIIIFRQQTVSIQILSWYLGDAHEPDHHGGVQLRHGETTMHTDLADFSKPSAIGPRHFILANEVFICISSINPYRFFIHEHSRLFNFLSI